MKPDPVIEAGRWLAQARDDLACARYALGGAFYAQACFVAQQASEEGMKSLACLEGARYVRGHSIAELLKGLSNATPSSTATSSLPPGWTSTTSRLGTPTAIPGPGWRWPRSKRSRRTRPRRRSAGRMVS
jgi:hypothetical protein